MASITVHCPRCQSALVYRHGQNPQGRDRFRCRDCHPEFLLTYPSEARRPRVKEQIAEMAFNGSKARQTGSGVLTTPKPAMFWLIPSGHEPMKPGTNCWCCSSRLISA